MDSSQEFTYNHQRKVDQIALLVDKYTQFLFENKNLELLTMITSASRAKTFLETVLTQEVFYNHFLPTTYTTSTKPLKYIYTILNTIIFTVIAKARGLFQEPATQTNLMQQPQPSTSHVSEPYIPNLDDEIPNSDMDIKIEYQLAKDTFSAINNNDQTSPAKRMTKSQIKNTKKN